jgi:hypothetical protein
MNPRGRNWRGSRLEKTGKLGKVGRKSAISSHFTFGGGRRAISIMLNERDRWASSLARNWAVTHCLIGAIRVIHFVCPH